MHIRKDSNVSQIQRGDSSAGLCCVSSGVTPAARIFTRWAGVRITAGRSRLLRVRSCSSCVRYYCCGLVVSVHDRSSEPIEKHLERNARGRAQSSVKPGVTRLMWWWSSSLQMLVKRWTLKPLPVNYRSKKLLVWRTNSTLDDFIFTLRFHLVFALLFSFISGYNPPQTNC